MTARSLFAALAAAYFLFIALTFIAPGASQGEAYAEDGTTSWEVDGDTAAVAITSAVRTVAVGFVLVALALVEWGAIVEKLREDERAHANG